MNQTFCVSCGAPLAGLDGNCVYCGSAYNNVQAKQAQAAMDQASAAATMSDVVANLLAIEQSRDRSEELRRKAEIERMEGLCAAIEQQLAETPAGRELVGVANLFVWLAFGILLAFGWQFFNFVTGFVLGAFGAGATYFLLLRNAEPRNPEYLELTKKLADAEEKLFTAQNG